MGVLAIANACGVEFGLAMDYLWANRRYIEVSRAGNRPAMHRREWQAVEATYAAIVKATSQATATALQERLEAACMDGDLYWPYPEWKAAVSHRPIYEKIEEEDDGIEPPYDPAALAAVADMRYEP